MTALTLSELAASVAERDPGAVAYVADVEQLMYSDWLVRADSLGAEFRDRGVGRGDVVALAFGSSIDFAIAYLAAARIGAVVTALNTRLGPREIEGILHRCEPTLVIHDPDSMALPVMSGDVLMARAEAAAISKIERPLTNPFGGDEDAPLTIVWTSGSTGMPKGAWFDQRGCRALASMSGVLSAPYDRRLMPIPFAHAGYMTRVWDQIHHVITSVITPPTLSAAETLDAMVQHRITVGQGVPTQWAKLVEVPGLAQADVSNLRICTTGAAPVPPELAQAITERFRCPVVVRYACTEAPILTGTLPGDLPEVLYGTVGRPAAGVEIQLVSPHGAPVDSGEVGRIQVRSPGSMRGFWNDPVATAAQVDADGWITVGDLGRLDETGNLILCGRTTEMYVRGGYNIYPLEVEHVLSEHPDVAAVAIVSSAAPVIGEIGIAFVVLHTPADDESLHASQLQTWVRQRLADYKAPDQVIYTTQLPLNSMMKIDKQQLRELLPN
jgi:acyl-CoA synthetase (AMP-forming)/AMP-acid ligase II